MEVIGHRDRTNDFPIAVVTVHNEAQNVADRETMQATVTDDAMWLDDGTASGTIDDYITVVMGYGPIEQTFTGEPTVGVTRLAAGICRSACR